MHPASKPGAHCPECFAASREDEHALQERIEQEGWQAVLGPIPEAMTMTAGTGEVITYCIPRGLRRRGGKRRR